MKTWDFMHRGTQFRIAVYELTAWQQFWIWAGKFVHQDWMNSVSMPNFPKLKVNLGFATIKATPRELWGDLGQFVCANFCQRVANYMDRITKPSIRFIDMPYEQAREVFGKDYPEVFQRGNGNLLKFEGSSNEHAN